MISVRRYGTILLSSRASIIHCSPATHISYRFKSYVEHNKLNIPVNWSASVVRPAGLLNVCPEGYCMAIQRSGQPKAMRTAGRFFAVPYLDKIKAIIDIRELSLPILDGTTTTKDNAKVTVQGNIICQIIDPEKAAYHTRNPIEAVSEACHNALAKTIKELTLEESLNAHPQIAESVKGAALPSVMECGVELKRYEITDIKPDQAIINAIESDIAAERERKNRIVQAEAEKKAAEIESEARKVRIQIESEGAMFAAKNAALATNERLRLEAEGEAAALVLRAKAQAEAIRILADAVSQPGGQEAAKLYLAREYIAMYGEIGQKSNSMIITDRPADINSLLANASSLFQDLSKKTP